mgnify:FL=1
MNRLTPFMLFMMMILTSCNTTDSNDYITAIPYQETEDGMWGMITTEGEVLFSKEFKNEPTVVKDGMFMVRNEDNNWEIYKAEKKPKKIGSEYTAATLFCNGRALVCEKDNYISIIDTDGKTIKTIDKIDGKPVSMVLPFYEGFAKYMTDECYGIIDEDGNPIIPADYCLITDCSDGKFIGVNKKYSTYYWNNHFDKIKYTVLNTMGEILFEIDGTEYNQVTKFENGLLPVYIINGNTEMWGIINEKQEVVVKPTKDIMGIIEIRNNMFTFYNKDGWGLMTTEGKILIKPKYNTLSFDGDDRLQAYYLYKDGKGHVKFIDINDNQLGKETFSYATKFSELDNMHSLVQMQDNSWSIINDKYEHVANLPKIANAEYKLGDDPVECNFVDIAKILDKLQISQNGMEGVTFQSSPKTVVEKLIKYRDNEDHRYPKASAYWFQNQSIYEYYKTINNLYASVEIEFYGDMSRAISDPKEAGNEDVKWYKNDMGIPYAYLWNDEKIKSFRLEFANDAMMRGKLSRMLDELKKRFKKAGRVVKENDGAIVIALDNYKTAFIYMKPKKVVATWGDIGYPEDFNISEYDGIKEDLSNKIYEEEYGEN